jgi:hypothetical protein
MRIYLDIDGVLNTNKFLKDAFDRGVLRNFCSAEAIDPSTIPFLNILEEKYHPEWVLSSSWRAVCSPRDITEILAKHGFTGKVTDMTGNFLESRASEIRSHLNRYGWAGPVVILDDDTDIEEIPEFAVTVDPKVGIDRGVVDRILAAHPPLTSK